MLRHTMTKSVNRATRGLLTRQEVEDTFSKAQINVNVIQLLTDT